MENGYSATNSCISYVCTVSNVQIDSSFVIRFRRCDANKLFLLFKFIYYLVLSIAANAATKHQKSNDRFRFIRNVVFIIIINIVVVVVTYAESKVNIAVQFNVGLGSHARPHLHILDSLKLFRNLAFSIFLGYIQVYTYCNGCSNTRRKSDKITKNTEHSNAIFASIFLVL